MFGFLLQLARAVLDEVLAGLASQFEIVTDQAFNPARAMVQQVVNGAWIGKGADRFVEEVSSMVIPGIGQVTTQISTMSGHLGQARDIIERADEEVDRLVRSSVYDAFGFY